MFVSKQLKENNIAEYLLYMWQVEDLIRANALDMERIKKTLVIPAHLDAEREAQLVEWYENLIEMMRLEGVSERGHLQINKNIITLLTDLHLQLLKSTKLQKRDISEGTLQASKAISQLLGLLSDYYKKDRAGELELE